MTEYCTDQDIKNRLTENGYRWVANRGGHGTPSTDEIASYITSAIQYAGGIIDGEIHQRYDLSVARGASNRWLRDRCIDIAAWWATGQGGRTPPETFVDAKNDALDRLEKVRAEGLDIPGLRGPSRARFAGLPRVVNPQ